MKLFFILFLSFFIFENSYSQNDSLLIIQQDTVTQKVKRTLNPTVAVTLSAILPGAGQIYNRKYYKVPFIYAFFYGIGYYGVKSHWAYRAYRSDILLMQDETIPLYLKYPTTGITDLSELGNQYNKFRRQRDLSVLIGIGWWALNIVDAYIDAELSNFDVSEDLSFNITPYYNTFQQKPSAGLTFQLRF